MPRFLLTAGNTREAIDLVRDWGNIFTGNTGFGIAQALTAVGEVDLLTSNATHLQHRQPQLSSWGFRSHADLRALLQERMTTQHYDAVFMSAAVADYRPSGAFEVVERRDQPDGTQTWTVRHAQAGKVKSHYREMAILGQRTEKLVDLFRTAWNFRGLLVKFKLEVGLTPQELIRVAEASRRASGADYLVANTLDMVTGDRAGAYLLSDQSPQWIPRGDLPARLLSIVRK